MVSVLPLHQTIVDDINANVPAATHAFSGDDIASKLLQYDSFNIWSNNEQRVRLYNISFGMGCYGAISFNRDAMKYEYAVSESWEPSEYKVIIDDAEWSVFKDRVLADINSTIGDLPK